MNIQRLVTSNQLSNAIRDLLFPIGIITARDRMHAGYKFDINVYESKLTTIDDAQFRSFSLFSIHASVTSRYPSRSSL